MNEILLIILLTLSPFLELRASIPYAILKTSVSPLLALPLIALSNILLAPLLYVFLNYLVHFFLRIPFFEKLWQRVIVRAQRRAKPYVDRYGTFGLALFISVPLPGSGVYSGALASYFLGLRFREYLLASIIGVILACVAVSLIVYFGGVTWLILTR